MTSAEGPKLVAIGEIARPHGVRGELKVKLYNQESTLLCDLDEVVLGYPDGEREIAQIAAARLVPDGALLRLVACTDREEADALRGTQLLVPREAFPKLGADEFYVTDIEGARVVDPAGEVGTVETLLSYPACDVLVVRTPSGKLEVPMVEAFVEKVDAASRLVVLRGRELIVPE